MDMRLTPLEKTEKEIDVSAEVTRLTKMTVPELRTRHVELFEEPAKSHHREFLARQIAWRLQAKVEGELPEETRQVALAVARDAPLRIRIEGAAARSLAEAELTSTTRITSNHDTRLPMPGSLLVREHKGETHAVRVLDNGFDYDGRLYRSLSAIAHEITGTKWNGFLFFGCSKEVSHGRR